MPVKPLSYQLGFSLDLPEPEDEGWVNPQEAALRLEMAKKMFEGQEEKPSWYEDYEQLLLGGWPFRVAVYIAWASMPTHNKQPKTVAELAPMIGLRSPRAIYTWRQRNKAIEEQISILQAAPLFKHRADAFDALNKSASDPDHRHNPDRRLLFQLTGDINDDGGAVQVNVGVSGDDLAKARSTASSYEQEMFGDLEGEMFEEGTLTQTPLPALGTTRGEGGTAPTKNPPTNEGEEGAE